MNIHANPKKTKLTANLGEFQNAGFALVLLSSPIAGDPRSGKRPLVEGWEHKPGATVKEADAHMRSGGNVGLRPPKTHVVIDFDPRHVVKADPAADPAAMHDEFVAHFGLSLDQCTVVNSGGGGKHIYLRSPEDVALTGAVPGYHGAFEIKKHSGQTVAPGSVHGSGGVYALATGVIPAQTATIPDALLDAIRKPPRKTATDGGRYAPDEIAAMLSGLDAKQFSDHDPWFELLAACHHASGGNAMREFIDWSTSDPAHSDQAEAIEYRWDTLDPAKQGFSVKTLFKALHEAGRPDLIVEKGEDLESSFDDLEDEEAMDSGKDKKQKRSLGLVPFETDTAAPLLEDTWLIEDVLPDSGMGAIYGEPGCGKTFMMLDMAFAVAGAQPKWRGKYVEHGSVIYLGMEGGRSFQNRVYAYKEERGTAEDFYRSASNLNLCSSEEDADLLIKEAKEIANIGKPVKLIVVDTLARAMAGGNENSPDDMGAFVTLCEKVRKAVGCFLIVVHHSGKDKARGMRGHSSLLGAVDNEINLDKAKGERTGLMKVAKQRDGFDGEEFGYQIEMVPIGRTGKRGKQISSCVIRHVDGPGPTGPKLKGQTAAAMTLLQSMADESGRCEIGAFREAAEEVGAVSESKKLDSRKTAVDRACKALLESRLVVQDDDYYRIPGHGGDQDEWAEIMEEPSTADLVAASVANHGRMSQRQLRGSVDGVTRAMLDELVDRLKAEPLGISTRSGVLIATKGRQAAGVDLIIEEHLDYSMV